MVTAILNRYFSKLLLAGVDEALFEFEFDLAASSTTNSNDPTQGHFSPRVLLFKDDSSPACDTN